jgi:hypothetical protein
MNRIQRTCCLLIFAMPLTAGELQRMSGQIENLSTQIAPKVVQIVTQGVKISGDGEEQPAGTCSPTRTSSPTPRASR